MKLVKPSLEIWEHNSGLSEIYKHIERCARICYKSEEHIKEGSAEKMVKRLIESKHGAMLEHGTIYLFLDQTSSITGYKYRDNPYSEYKEIRITEEPSPKINKYITTNYRVIIENGWEDDLKYQCEPTEHHIKRITVKFILSRAIANEFVRHRTFSFSQESTRYCSYDKAKFCNSIAYVIPSHLDIPEGDSYYKDGFGFKVGANLSNHELGFIKKCVNYNSFLIALENAEKSYFQLLKEGWQPQQARGVLPLDLKTELVMTGTLAQWNDFFVLRCAGAAHPDAQVLAKQLQEQFKVKYGIN